jgi:polyphosphate kinase
LIKKRSGKKTIQYGFVSTGNLNEQTAKVYGDHCLLTTNRHIMADINRIFRFIQNPKNGINHLKACKTLMVCPTNMRKQLAQLINTEIKNAKAKKPARIIAKLNSLSDVQIINRLYAAAQAGVEVKLIVRGIFCAMTEQKKLKHRMYAISIVDEYLEHARVMIFHNNGKEKIYISSADWMIRNLDHRVEAAAFIIDENIRQEIKDIIHIQLRDNVKARILDNALSNNYVSSKGQKRIRSQIETYNYLRSKIQRTTEVPVQSEQLTEAKTIDYTI